MLLSGKAGKSENKRNMMTPTEEFSNLQKSILTIVKKSGTSFYWAIRPLPIKKRRAMFAIYAFCRKVDDIADSNELTEKKILKLKKWRGKIESLYDNSPTDLITNALAKPIADYNLNKEDFIAIIDGMETDAVDQLRMSNKKELLIYCDRVACAVGRLSNEVFGISPEQGKDLAKSLGEALQLTNILRDISEDAEKNRVYIPRDLLKAYGNNNVTVDEILNHRGFDDACKDLAAVTRARFKEAESAIKKCDKKLITSALIMMKLYHQLFLLLQQRGWKDYNVPVKVSGIWKLWTIARILIFKQ